MLEEIGKNIGQNPQELVNLASPFNNLNDIFIEQDVFSTDFLRVVLGTGPPHKSMFEFFGEGLVDLIAEVLHSAVQSGHDNRSLVVRNLALRKLVADRQQEEKD